MQMATILVRNAPDMIRLSRCFNSLLHLSKAATRQRLTFTDTSVVAEGGGKSFLTTLYIKNTHAHSIFSRKPEPAATPTFQARPRVTFSTPVTTTSTASTASTSPSHPKHSTTAASSRFTLSPGYVVRFNGNDFTLDDLNNMDSKRLEAVHDLTVNSGWPWLY